MYIKKLTLKNFQVIKDFDAEFDGNVYFVTGDNELGKSTLLKAIGVLLTGNRDDVLKIGEQKGFAKMVVGDDGEEYDVSLSFTEANPRGTLSIKQKTTGMQSSNVSMLQKIFGYQDFDAVEFSRWSETAEGRRKQIAVVKALLPAEIRTRIEELDEDVRKMKEERTGVNRDVKTFTSILEEASAVIRGIDVEKYRKPIDVAELMAAQAQVVALDEKAKTVQAALKQRTEQLEEIPLLENKIKAQCSEALKQAELDLEIAKKKYDEAVKSAKNIESERLEKLKTDKADYELRKANAEKWLANYDQSKAGRKDFASELEDAESHNRKCVLVEDYEEKNNLLKDAKTKAERLDSSITEKISERAGLIAKSKLPIKGLTFTDDGLELNGVPFVPGKVSDSQIMEVAAKLVIVSNPRVKVFRIARGESLGKARLKNIVDIANKYGYQGFIEQVQRGQTEMQVEEYSEEA